MTGAQGVVPGQLTLPGLGVMYPSVAAARKLGERRYARHLVFLACLEIGRSPFCVWERTQQSVRIKTEEIHRRHHPTDQDYDGVPERSLRRDPACRRHHRRLRRLAAVGRSPDDPALGQATREELLAAVADRDSTIAGHSARIDRLEVELAETLAELLRHTALHGALPVAVTSDDAKAGECLSRKPG